MSRAQLDAELMKGVESMQFGKTYTADEVDAEPAREFGIRAPLIPSFILQRHLMTWKISGAQLGNYEER